MKVISNDSGKTKNDHILFPGTSCYPLSPYESRDPKNQAENVISNKDQMKVIIQRLRKQSDLDFSFLQSEDAVEYLKSLTTPKEDQYFMKAVSNSLDDLQVILEKFI